MFEENSKKNNSYIRKKIKNRFLNPVKKIFIVIFLVIIIITPILTNHKKNQLSKLDNSSLFEINSFSEIIENPMILENYLTDRIGFRDSLISLYSNITTKSVNVLNHPIYDYGKNDEVFYKFNQPEDLTEYIEDFSDFLLRLQDYIEGNGKEFLLVISPSKNSVYPEYIPDTIVDNNENIKTLKKELEKNNIKNINLTESLVNGKSEGRMFNKKYDVGHWSDHGSIIGINSFMSKLQENNSNIQDFNTKNFEIVNSFKKYLPTSKIPINENITKYTPKDVKSKRDANKIENIKEEINIDEKYNTFINYYNLESDKSPSALFFTGSYLNNRYAYFSDYFSEIFGIHNYENIINADYYMNLFDTDIVVFEVAETAITPDYFNQKNLINKKFNPPYDEVKDFIKIRLKDKNKDNILLNINTKKELSDIEINTKSYNLPDFDYAYIITKDNKVYSTSKTISENKEDIINTSMWNEDVYESKIILTNTSTKTNYYIDFSTLQR